MCYLMCKKKIKTRIYAAPAVKGLTENRVRPPRSTGGILLFCFIFLAVKGGGRKTKRLGVSCQPRHALCHCKDCLQNHHNNPTWMTAKIVCKTFHNNLARTRDCRAHCLNWTIIMFLLALKSSLHPQYSQSWKWYIHTTVLCCLGLQS